MYFLNWYDCAFNFNKSHQKAIETGICNDLFHKYYFYATLVDTPLVKNLHINLLNTLQFKLCPLSTSSNF